jgi:hypothetical protein
MVALTALLTVINIVLAVRNLWKEWQSRRGSGPHHVDTRKEIAMLPLLVPLEAALRDVASAIRERG